MKLTLPKTDTLPEITWERLKLAKETEFTYIYFAYGKSSDDREWSAYWTETETGIEITEVECEHEPLTDLPQDWEPDYNGSSFKESHQRAWKEKQRLG